MKAILRNVLAVLAGMLLGGVVNMTLVMVGPRVVPSPAGVDMADAASLAAGIHLLEPRHFLFPFLAHALGTWVGALTASLIAATRGPVPAWVLGGINLAGGILASTMIPAPGWFIALDLVLAYLPMAWLGGRLGRSLRG
jgi:hypothetical protein